MHPKGLIGLQCLHWPPYLSYPLASSDSVSESSPAASLILTTGVLGLVLALDSGPLRIPSRLPNIISHILAARHCFLSMTIPFICGILYISMSIIVFASYGLFKSCKMNFHSVPTPFAVPFPPPGKPKPFTQTSS